MGQDWTGGVDDNSWGQMTKCFQRPNSEDCETQRNDKSLRNGNTKCLHLRPVLCAEMVGCLPFHKYAQSYFLVDKKGPQQSSREHRGTVG